MAKCISCGKRVHSKEYPLDSSNSELLAKDYGYTGPDAPMCFVCSNDEGMYTYGLNRAKRKWVKMPEADPTLEDHLISINK